MDVLKLIDEIEDIVENAGSMPFSKKVIVDSEEILEIVKELRLRIPDEMKQANWINEEKERILMEAHNNAEKIMNNAEGKLEELIEDEVITKKAEARAQELILNAQNSAKEIRLGAIDYADSMLEDTQKNIKEVFDLITENRKDLRGQD